MIKAQDILVVLKLAVMGERNLSFSDLGQTLHMSASETHAAFRRARKSGLIHPLDDVVIKSSLAEFLIHGLKYLLPAQKGPRTRGMPTGYAAPPFVKYFMSSLDDQEISVWPDAEGEVSGMEIRPICRSAPKAAQRDPELYEWLVLADVLRGAGHARERELAIAMVKERLDWHEGNES